MIGRGTPESRCPPLVLQPAPLGRGCCPATQWSGQGSILLPWDPGPGPAWRQQTWALLSCATMWALRLVGGDQRNSLVCLQTRCRVARSTQRLCLFLGVGPSVHPDASLTSVSRHLQGQVGGDKTQVSPDPPFPHRPAGQSHGCQLCHSEGEAP